MPRVHAPAGDTPNDKLLWLIIIHLAFVLSALLMAVIERFLVAKGKTAPASVAAE